MMPFVAEALQPLYDGEGSWPIGTKILVIRATGQDLLAIAPDGGLVWLEGPRQVAFVRFVDTYSFSLKILTREAE